MADTLGKLNPLRYRGYIYDTETELYYLQSRYYDPQVGRFLNADALVSTGQGILGNNMFAYCNNNPVNYTDFKGSVPSKDYCVALGPDCGTNYEYIYDQTSSPHGETSLGIASVSHGGCGPVAVYNAMLMLGNYASLNEIIDYFEQDNGIYFGGLLGSSFYTCANYFRDQGYSVYTTKEVAAYSDLAASADACILWCWFDTKGFPFVGAHFMAFKQNGTMGRYYNPFSGSTSPYDYNGDCYSFLRNDYDGYYPALILIYDTNGG